jgi:HAD superfamily hydrolase (TIGR01490 family)
MNKPVVAAFDFDGTLTYRDALLPFLISVLGPVHTFSKILLQVPSILGFVCGYVSRQQTKEGILTKTIGGMSKDQLFQQGNQYAAGALNRLVKPEALERLRWHQSQGHRCVLISATLDVFLEPWSKREGFQDLICSQLEVDQQRRVTGRLVGLNCWGPEKTRRLIDLIGPKETFTLYAYGDSRGDRELLELADYPYYRRFV